MAEPADDLRETVRRRYAAAAVEMTRGGAGCCGDVGCSAGAVTTLELGESFGSALYSQLERDDLPVAAVAASLGCGNPTAVADLRPGERVLDLGSGGGIDVLLSATRVGPTGFAYGVDMTTEMLDLSRANATRAGAVNVEFLRGLIENIPLPDGAVDVIISNCVINLSTDKPAVLAEMFRVLTPGGRIGINDVVAEDELTAEQRAERGAYLGCIAGALSRREYLDGLAAAGFVDPTVEFTHPVADQMHSAIIRASRPAEWAAEPTGGCCSNQEAATCCESTAKADCCGTTAATNPNRRAADVGDPARPPGAGRAGRHGWARGRGDRVRDRRAAAVPWSTRAGAAGEQLGHRDRPRRPDRSPPAGVGRVQPPRHPRRTRSRPGHHPACSGADRRAAGRRPGRDDGREPDVQPPRRHRLRSHAGAEPGSGSERPWPPPA